MEKTQEPKYKITQKGKIAYYAKLCADEHHKKVVKKRLHDFVDFIHKHPEKIKEPDTFQSDCKEDQDKETVTP